MDWVTDVEVKGTMWATPGPYLRKSMLVSLARRVSDNYLPQALYKNTTFEEAPGCPQKSKDEETTLEISLKLGIENEELERLRIKRKRIEIDDDSESNEGDSEGDISS